LKHALRELECNGASVRAQTNPTIQLTYIFPQTANFVINVDTTQKVSNKKSAAAIAKGWDSFHDKLGRITTSITTVVFVSSINIESLRRKSVLEVGCGDLASTPAFEEVDYVGLDISQNALDKARHKMAGNLKFNALNSVELIKADIRSGVNLPSGTFDFAFGVDSFPFFAESLPDAIREIGRLLKVGGLLQFTTFHPQFIKEKSGIGLSAFGHFGYAANVDGPAGEMVALDEMQIKRLLGSNGFQTMDIATFTKRDARLKAIDFVGHERIGGLDGSDENLKFFSVVKALRRD